MNVEIWDRATVFIANSYEKFEAKISEKSEKKGSEYLKRTSESHVKRISVRLLFALKRKNFLSETGAPYFHKKNRGKWLWLDKVILEIFKPH
jgi:hypothetical protein